MAKSSKYPKGARAGGLTTPAYDVELFRLQAEYVKLQEWVKAERQRVVIIFEGRDAAGKGGTIKRLTQYLSPRSARLPRSLHRPIVSVASGTSSVTWKLCRQPERSPCSIAPGTTEPGGEGDGLLRTPEERRLFLRQCPAFEQMLIEDKVLLRKYWFSVSDAEQQKRFTSRLADPMLWWKLSPMDLESIARWEDYSRAKEKMMAHTDTPSSPGTYGRPA